MLALEIEGDIPPFSGKDRKRYLANTHSIIYSLQNYCPLYPSISQASKLAKVEILIPPTCARCALYFQHGAHNITGAQRIIFCAECPSLRTKGLRVTFSLFHKHLPRRVTGIANDVHTLAKSYSIATICPKTPKYASIDEFGTWRVIALTFEKALLGRLRA